MEMEDRKLSYYSLEPHLFNLRALGYFPIDPNSPKLQRSLDAIYMRLSLVLIIVYTIQQAIRVIQVRDDIDKVIETLFLFLTHTDSIYKQIILWIKADQIENLLNTMRGPLYNQGKADHRQCLLQTAQHGKFLLRINNTLAIVTCFLWVLYPLILHTQGKYVEFPIWLPFDVNANPQYNLTKLVPREEEETILNKNQYSSTLYENIISRRFKKNIRHHKEIVQFAKKIQDVFGAATAYQFLVSGWIICTSVYKMVQVNPLSVQFLSMIMYITCMLIELFLYCYYGSQVTHESEMLTYSAYDMNWLGIPLKYRRYLIIFMERIKFPIHHLAGFIIPLSNNTFMSIVKSSYTFYAILKNSNE